MLQLLIPISLIFLQGCAAWDYLTTPDNAVEEVVEDVIKLETGLDIDLTPGTPEKK